MSTSRLLFVFVALVGLGALGFVAVAVLTTPPKGATPGALLPPPEAESWPGDPWTFAGGLVGNDILTLALGPEACGYESVLLLTMNDRLGQSIRTSDDARQYVRDPANRFATVGAFEASVAKPPDAAFTGYRYGSMELWLSAAAGSDAVLLRRDAVWEKWPRAQELLACG